MNRFLISNFSSHLRNTFAVNSGPLSDLIWQGNPLFKNSSERTSTTSRALKCLLTFNARHSLVYSSIRVRILKDRPSWVRSAAKSYDQTWFLNSGFKRKQDPSYFLCKFSWIKYSRYRLHSSFQFIGKGWYPHWASCWPRSARRLDPFEGRYSEKGGS